jgi:VIT1/CCC1 family predicted Fe2+/Mn2+ transporter
MRMTLRVAPDLPEQEVEYHEHQDPHAHQSPIAALILGGQDGLVNVLGVILGVAAATGDSRVVIAAGLATTFAESLSMAAVAYTSTVAEGDLYKSERAREYRHLERAPAVERAEVRAIYERRGFRGELLDRIVETITANPDVWVAVMMSEEHHRAPVSRRQALRSAAIVGAAAAAGSFLPLIPFLVLTVRWGSWVSIATAASALFVMGAWKARHTVGRPWKSGVEMAAIGTVAALVGYAIGALFQAPATP